MKSIIENILFTKILLGLGKVTDLTQDDVPTMCGHTVVYSIQ